MPSTQLGAKRVLIDSLTDVLFASGDELRFREYMYSLIQRCSRAGVSLFMTSELPDLFSVTRLSEYGVSHLSDNVLVLQYIRDESTIRRAITALKTRASGNDPRHPRISHRTPKASPSTAHGVGDCTPSSSDRTRNCLRSDDLRLCGSRLGEKGTDARTDLHGKGRHVCPSPARLFV